jgi:hypothetical protein
MIAMAMPSAAPTMPEKTARSATMPAARLGQLSREIIEISTA